MGANPRMNAIEYMGSAAMGEKGQLIVPKRFREELGLRTGAPLAMLRLGDGLILLPEQPLFEQLCRRMSSALTGAGIKPEAVLATLPKARQDVFRRHYGSAASRKGNGGQLRKRLSR